MKKITGAVLVACLIAATSYAATLSPPQTIQCIPQGDQPQCRGYNLNFLLNDGGTTNAPSTQWTTYTFRNGQAYPTPQYQYITSDGRNTVTLQTTYNTITASIIDSAWRQIPSGYYLCGNFQSNAITVKAYQCPYTNTPFSRKGP